MTIFKIHSETKYFTMFDDISIGNLHVRLIFDLGKKSKFP